MTDLSQSVSARAGPWLSRVPEGPASARGPPTADFLSREAVPLFQSQRGFCCVDFGIGFCSVSELDEFWFSLNAIIFEYFRLF